VKGYVEGRWGQVHYRSEGDAGPVVVLYHESPLSSAVYEAALPLLAERGLRAVAFDTPGYGMSDAPERAMEIPDYAAALVEAAANLELEPYAVAGSHTGASLAVQAALQAGPERITRAILSGVIVLEPEDRHRYLTTWAPPMSPSADGSHFDEAWQRFERIYGADTDPQLIHLAAVTLLECIDKYDWAYNAAFRYDPAPDLPDLRVPVAFLIAENDGFVEADRRAVGLVPGAVIHEIPELRGQLPLRVPEVFADEVAAFVLDR
jgi:pimeloyl-ACP methyl ester carboxylesterase